MESTLNTARFLDMTDRVDVLGSMYRSCESEEDFLCIDAILSEFYPSLLHFFADSVKKEESVIAIQACLEENAVAFVTIFEDGSCQDYHYSEMDPLLT